MTTMAVAEREPLAGLGSGLHPRTSAWDAECLITELYAQHYRALVQLAVLWVRDMSTAEEVVQDSFIAIHGGWRRLRDTDNALPYLRQAVVNRARSVLRHRGVVERSVLDTPPDVPSAEQSALARLEQAAVLAALRELTDRQREAITLRYFAGLSECEIAAAMRVSRGSVKSHTSRGMAALRTALQRD